jgi:hypothetical protein
MFDADDKLGSMTLDLRPMAAAAMGGDAPHAGGTQWYPLSDGDGEVRLEISFEPAVVAEAKAAPPATKDVGKSTAAKLLSHVTARREQSKAILKRAATRKEHTKDLIQAISSVSQPTSAPPPARRRSLTRTTRAHIPQHKEAQEASEQEEEAERLRADERARATAAATAEAVKARLRAAKLRPSSPRRPTLTRRELRESGRVRTETSHIMPATSR